MPKTTTQVIDEIRTGKLSDAELVQLYENCAQRGAANVLEAIRVQMRAQFPRTASRVFGARQAQATSRLQDVLATLNSRHRLSMNRVKSHVKVGGDQRSSNRPTAKHIDVYISYKNARREGAALALRQDSPDSEMRACVTRYQTGRGRASHEEVFTMDGFDAAVARYEAHLCTLLQQGV